MRQRLIDLEKSVNDGRGDKIRKWPATFFASGTIPARFCSISGVTEEACIDEEGNSIPARIAYVPTAADVFRYIDSVDEDQLPLLPARSCMSVYNLCE
jgi:hypothetical protein